MNARVLLGWLASGGQAGLDLLLPPHCLTCPAPVEAPGRLCVECFGRTSFVTEPCCVRCGVPFASTGQGGRNMTCPGCEATPPAWRQARAALRYDEQTRRIVMPFKYGGRVEIAVALARHMQRAGATLLQQAEVLVPVPLHRRRLRARRLQPVCAAGPCPGPPGPASGGAGRAATHPLHRLSRREIGPRACGGGGRCVRGPAGAGGLDCGAARAVDR